MKPHKPSELLQVDTKNKESYRSFSLVHLTAYTVHWLTEWEIPTTYENVSVLNARLFPSDFGMQGFPEFPDGLRTNRSLLQMRPKYRGFATSDPRQGVHLTERGLAEALKVIDAVGAPTLNGVGVVNPATEVDPRRKGREKERTRNPAKIVSDIRSKIVYRHFSEGKIDEAEVPHLLGLLGVYDHTPPTEVRKAFTQLRRDATEVGDKEMTAFLDAVGIRFSDYLNRKSSK